MTQSLKVQHQKQCFLNLSNAVNATIADNQGQGNIIDNDVQPTISISDATIVTEGGNLVFTISLSNASYQAVTVDYITAMGTALDPQDYAGLSSQTLTFAAGETSKTISVSTLDDDTIFEMCNTRNNVPKLEQRCQCNDRR